MIFRDERDGRLNFDNHESIEERIEILEKYLNSKEQFSEEEIAKIRGDYDNNKEIYHDKEKEIEDKKFNEWLKDYIKVPDLDTPYILKGELKERVSFYKDQLKEEDLLKHAPDKFENYSPELSVKIDNFFYGDQRKLDMEFEDLKSLEENTNKRFNEVLQQGHADTEENQIRIENVKKQQLENPEFNYDELINSMVLKGEKLDKKFQEELLILSDKQEENAKKRQELEERQQELDNHKKAIMLQYQRYEKYKNNTKEMCKENGLILKEYYDENTGIEKTFFITPDYRQIGTRFDPSNPFNSFNYVLDPEKDITKTEPLSEKKIDSNVMARTLVNTYKQFEDIQSFVDQTVENGKENEQERLNTLQAYSKSINFNDILDQSFKENKEAKEIEKVQEQDNYYNKNNERIYELVAVQTLSEKIRDSFTKNGLYTAAQNFKTSINEVWQQSKDKLNDFKEKIVNWWDTLDKYQADKKTAMIMGAGIILLASHTFTQSTQTIDIEPNPIDPNPIVEYDCGDGHHGYGMTLEAAKNACDLHNPRETSETKGIVTTTLEKGEDYVVSYADATAKAGQQELEKTVYEDSLVNKNTREDETLISTEYVVIDKDTSQEKVEAIQEAIEQEETHIEVKTESKQKEDEIIKEMNKEIEKQLENNEIVIEVEQEQTKTIGEKLAEEEQKNQELLEKEQIQVEEKLEQAEYEIDR